MNAKYARNLSKINSLSLRRVYTEIKKTALEGECRIQITLTSKEVDALKLNGYVVERYSPKSNFYEVSWYDK